MLSLTEFTGINANGDKEERQQTFSQSTTTGVQNWMWNNELDSDLEWALLMVDLAIPKFEYTSIEVRGDIQRLFNRPGLTYSTALAFSSPVQVAEGIAAKSVRFRPASLPRTRSKVLPRRSAFVRFSAVFAKGHHRG